MATPGQKELTGNDQSRGIQNATSRFKRQREGQLLQSELLGEADRGRYEGEAANDSSYSANDPEYEGRPRSSKKKLRNRLQESQRSMEQALTELAKTQGLPYEAGDAELILKNTPEHPPFPMIIFLIALIKDLLDGLEVTGIGIIFTTALSFLLAVVLFLWNFHKLSGGWWKKKLIKKLWIKWGISTAIEFIPFGKMIPATTIFVLMAHYDETKLVRLLNGALERMRHGGIS